MAYTIHYIVFWIIIAVPGSWRFKLYFQEEIFNDSLECTISSQLYKKLQSATLQLRNLSQHSTEFGFYVTSWRGNKSIKAARNSDRKWYYIVRVYCRNLRSHKYLSVLGTIIPALCLVFWAMTCVLCLFVCGFPHLKGLCDVRHVRIVIASSQTTTFLHIKCAASFAHAWSPPTWYILSVSCWFKYTVQS
jgi:hypothetical protein